MAAIICNRADLNDTAMILRDRIWRENDDMLQVDTYPYSFDGDRFDEEAWHSCQVYIPMTFDFTGAYRSARLLLRRLGLTPDTGEK